MAKEKKYNFDSPKVIDSLEDFAKRFDHAAERDAQEGNETERHLSGQLILLTTVLITVNILFLGDGNIISALNTLQRTGVLIALFFEGIATVAGIINYFRIEQKYRESANIWATCAEVVRKRTGYSYPTQLFGRLESEQKPIRERDENRGKNKIALYVQIGMILSSLLIYLILLGTIFFATPQEPPSCTQISDTSKICPINYGKRLP